MARVLSSVHAEAKTIEERSALLQEMVGDDAGHFDDAFFFGADYEAKELRHAPGEWCGATGATAKHKSCTRGLRLVPYLFWNHAALVRK